MKTKGASGNLLSAIEHTYPKFVSEKIPYFPLSRSGTKTRSWYNNWLPYLKHRDTLHCQEASYIWAWECFAAPKSRLHKGNQKNCTTRKPHMHCHGNHLPCQKAICMWAWEYFAPPKISLYMGMRALCTTKQLPPYMGMETLCNGKKTSFYKHGDTLPIQKSPLT